MYIKDLETGEVRKYGTELHDALVLSDDGRTLSYRNLQNGDGSMYGNYRICEENGEIPSEIDVCIQHGAEVYFAIGGFENEV